jgi:hypothetical protein
MDETLPSVDRDAPPSERTLDEREGTEVGRRRLTPDS